MSSYTKNEKENHYIVKQLVEVMFSKQSGSCECPQILFFDTHMRNVPQLQPHPHTNIGALFKLADGKLHDDSN